MIQVVITELADADIEQIYSTSSVKQAKLLLENMTGFLMICLNGWPIIQKAVRHGQD